MRPSLSTIRQRSLSRSLTTTSAAKQPLSAAAASLDTIPVELSESITIPRIADIFDVSPRLGDAGRELSRQGQMASKPKVVSARRHEATASTASPFSLPAPVFFDGPARPPGASPVWPRYISSSSSPHRHSSSILSSISMGEPSIEVFDGPSRITRYQHPKTPGRKQKGVSLSTLAIGAATAVGGAVMLGTDQ
ncbi:hypothetical protein Moror_17263 [Moniliophthora roreri MCA 2997]|uniref:Uncharacterized protein n=2 Tax=Moniliophthora roreri TaxID=221103 RepID=V2Z1K4_MONRO|nr:hypothetical protein Moror_17263 [Moniliophthora roreri MCA 2997]KAI3602541.1 hypothetical protein WG66_009275 [Moniliophthora roreri]